MRWPIVPKNKATLVALATPENANQPESIGLPIYDTQPATTGVASDIVFFQTQSSDPTITNMEGSGQLPDPQFFEVWSISVEPMFPHVSQSATVAGNIDDLHQLLYGARGIVQLEMSNKIYGPWPLSFCHGNGGPTGFLAGAPAAPGTTQFGGNGVQDGGLWQGGQIVIPPKVGFRVRLRFGTAPTLTATPLNLRCSLIGTLHRRVL